MRRWKSNDLFVTLVIFSVFWFLVTMILSSIKFQPVVEYSVKTIDVANIDKIRDRNENLKADLPHALTVRRVKRSRATKISHKRFSSKTFIYNESYQDLNIDNNLDSLPEASHYQRISTSNIFGMDNLGELGVEVTMPSNLPLHIQKLYDDGWQRHQFNEYLSDLISVRRELPDYRTEYCKKIESSYSENLPATSVIIIFHNEAWSTLLRSVHSVLDRSPAHLITEVILVDDFSDMGESHLIERHSK